MNNLKEVPDKKTLFAALFRTFGDAIIFGDQERKLTLVNPGFTKMFGYSPEEVIGKKTEVLYGSPDEYERQGKLRYNLSAEEKLKPYEVQYCRQNGELFWGETVGSIVKDKHGNIFGFGGIIRDITERKQAEEALRKAYHEIEQLKNRLQAENVYLQEEIKFEHNFDEIVSTSESFKKILRNVEQVAATDATVLILGETGTGKELIARALHILSPRKERPLVKVNCSALPANLIESELFGHEKGAFTGAIARKIGRFELADGGTIFLDEIGDLPPELQAKLLRVLQEGELERLGNSKTIKVDVRVIAATNRDLEKAIEKGDFREDLFYRLNVFPITIPPLRQRNEDIPLLAKHFVKKYSAKMGKKIDFIPEKVMSALRVYHWAGNVRELENVIERAVILTPGSALQVEEFVDPQTEEGDQTPSAKTLEIVERNHILQTLNECNWKISGKNGTAEILGLHPSTLRDRMQKLGLKKPSRDS
ncbi:MAG: sigma 54-interacting transcriptional regulator [Bacteroidetes bacterium]|nr:sigma 54-interacting transcriptional regulator [Bacteroidota bacterium]